MSALLELTRSTVSCVLVKVECLGATTAQLLSGRPHNLTEWDRQVLKCIARKNPLSSVDSSPSGSPTDESGFGDCQENATCPNA